MASVDIANEALIRLGEATITTLSDSAANAVTINAVFGEVKDMMLAEYPWSWATTRADLVSNASTNYTDYEYMYDVPTAALRLLNLFNHSGSDSAEGWKIEGQYLYTDQVSAMMSYVQSVADTTLMSNSFRRALSAKLAFELCLNVTQNLTLRDRLFREYVYAFNQAQAEDGHERESEEDEPKLWTSAR